MAFRVPFKNLSLEFQRIGSSLWAPLGRGIDRNFDEIERRLDLPAASVFGSANQGGFTTGDFTQVEFDLKRYDFGGNFSNNQYVCPRAGVVHVGSILIWTANASMPNNGSSHSLSVFKNGVRYKDIEFDTFGGNAALGLCGATDVDVSAGSTLEIHAFQAAGVTLTAFGDAVGQTRWADFRYVPVPAP